VALRISPYFNLQDMVGADEQGYRVAHLDHEHYIYKKDLSEAERQAMEAFEKEHPGLIKKLKTTGDIASFVADLTPGIGDIKSFAEAEDGLDYALATVGLIPGADIVTKPLKAAKESIQKARVAEKLGNTADVIKYQKEAAIEEAQQTEKQLKTQWINLQEEYQLNLQKYQFYKQEALPEAERIIRANQLGYSAGEISYVEYLYTLQTAVDTRLAYLESIEALNQKVIEIQSLLNQ